MKRDLAFGALLVLALVAVSFVTVRKPEATKAATHASGDYGPGGYRAWSELLTREGFHVERFRRHHDALADEGVDTLIVAFPDAPVPFAWNPAERDALRAWVRRGGRLIDVGVTPPSGARDDVKGEAVLLRPARGAGPLEGPWSATVSALEVRGNERIAPRRGAQVKILLTDGAGPLVVRYRAGRGEVIAVASTSLFENRVLARADAARLAYLVARPRRPDGVVAFDEAIRGETVERPWYRAIDVPERVGLGIAALAGLLWFAYGLFPLGPPVRLRAPREPTSAEFLDAIAALYERARARAHARDALVSHARRVLERAPRTPENRTLAARIDAAGEGAVGDDATLVAVARLARTAREENIMATDRSAHDPMRGRASRRGWRGRVA